MNAEIQSKVTAFIAQHSRRISIGGGGIVFGLLLVVTIYWVVDLVLAPSVPDVQTASADQVASFLANRRGFSRMPIEDRRRMLFDIWSAGPELTDGLADAFARLSSEDRGQVRIAAMQVAMDHLERAARVYRQLSPAERDRFVDQFIDGHEELREQLRDMADAFKDNLPTHSDQWTKSLVTQTTPKQRAQVKPFVDHVMRVAEQRKMVNSRHDRALRRAREG